MYKLCSDALRIAVLQKQKWFLVVLHLSKCPFPTSGFRILTAFGIAKWETNPPVKILSSFYWLGTSTEKDTLFRAWVKVKAPRWSSDFEVECCPQQNSSWAILSSELLSSEQLFCAQQQYISFCSGTEQLTSIEPSLGRASHSPRHHMEVLSAVWKCTVRLVNTYGMFCPKVQS